MKRFYETAVILIGTLGWWGYVYPELSLTQQAYVQETETDRLTEADVVTGILKELGSNGIEVGEIRIKSRIAEYVYQVKKDMVEKGAEDD